MSRASQVMAGVVALASGGVPSLAAGQNKLVAPVHGEVKNVEKAPIAGFKVEEYWYDRAGNPLGGGNYRHPRPLQPGEIITVTLKTPRSTNLDRNQVGFVHAYGPVKKTVVPKLVPPKPAT